MDPRERTPYSAIVDRPPLKLPGDARIVVWPVFNIENWDTMGPMPRTVLTPPGGVIQKARNKELGSLYFEALKLGPVLLHDPIEI